jgi:acetyltransferase-like isoleucine patch superfamily enzyme
MAAFFLWIYWATVCEEVTINADVLIGGGATLETLTRVRAHATVGVDAYVGRVCEVGSHAVVPDNVHVGSLSYIPSNSKFVADLGFSDGYRRILVSIEGRAFIAAGCRLLTLPAAFRHWTMRNSETDRRAALAAVYFADSIATIHGLKVDDDPGVGDDDDEAEDQPQPCDSEE